MSDEAAFLAAIIANPEDDLPRLVLADWYDENGQGDRAEFIRLQIDHSRKGKKPPRVLSDHPIYVLFARHRDQWLAEFPKGFANQVPHGQFRRGFLAVLRVTPAKFARIPKKAWAMHPIEELHLGEVRGQLRRVLTRPEVNRLRELSFQAITRDGLTADDISALADTPNLTGLRKLEVRVRSGNPFADALAACPSLRGLESLYLSDNGFDGVGAAALARSANLANLRKLQLGLTHMSERTIGALAASPMLARLEDLSLYRGGRIGNGGAALMAASPHFANLRHLWLSDQAIGAVGAAALGGSKHLVNLRSVRLNRNAVGPAGVRAIMTGTWAAVEELELDHCSLGDAEAAAIAERGTLTKLTELNLSDNDIGPAGAIALSKAKWLRRLTHLDLENNPIGDEGALALCKSKALAGLTKLRVGPIVGEGFSPAVTKQLKARFGKEVVG